MTKSISSFILLLFIPCIAVGGDLKPFTTDACSSFPNGNIEHQSLWASCCVRHDLAYWKGGTYEERLEADNNLAACVSQVGEPEIAALMLAGVRVGGSPYYPTPYRWGYGWPYPRGYGALSKEEKQEVREKLDYFRLMISTLYEELK
jgi:hypothetical protein